MRLLVIGLAVAGQGASAAAPPDDPFCEDVRTLVRGAEEAEPFRSLRERDFAPRLLRTPCSFNGAGGYTCGHNLARRGETRAAYAGRIHACLPGSVRTEGDGEETVQVGRFVARVSERGSDRGKVGRSINIYIEAVPGDGLEALRQP